MRYRRFINNRRFLSGVLMLIGCCMPMLSCYESPSYRQNPIIFHFYTENTDEYRTVMDDDRAENIKQWKSLTSTQLDDNDVEDGVYSPSLAQLQSWFKSGKTSNTFVRWIIDNKADDLRDFLLLAKELEELRENRVSPWYYPSDRNGFDKSADEQKRFESIIGRCRAHSKGRLADRYGLQAVRALMSVGRYQECLDYYESNMRRLPVSNLMKRMAKGYIARCHRMLGNTDKADRIYAEIGDFNSISNKSRINLSELVRRNPESKVVKNRLNHYIGYGDAAANLKYLAVADAALSSKHIKNRGDWTFLKAYIELLFRDDKKKAYKYVKRAMKQSFSTPEMRNDARLLLVSMMAENDQIPDLINDVDTVMKLNSDVVLFSVVPALLRKGRKSEAMLLVNACGADYTVGNDTAARKPYIADTGSQFMLSCKAQDVVAYKRFLASADPVVRHYKKMVATDEDYLNELIGTMYLREGNYAKAVEYLEKVSEKYQRSLGIYQMHCLEYDPWEYAYKPESKWNDTSYKVPGRHGEFDDYEYVPELRPVINEGRTRRLGSQKDAKLNFAREMLRLEKEMMNASKKDDRILAGMRYAIGRYNSFNTCWALTQYWCGNAAQLDYQPFYYRYSKDSDEYLSRKIVEIDYLINLPREMQAVNDGFEKKIISLYDKLTTEEGLAAANLTLRNYRTIAMHYPNSEAARLLQKRCDSWKDWLM